jgi:TRAP-type C4-dicarboxylate transport system permease small subunit
MSPDAGQGVVTRSLGALHTLEDAVLALLLGLMVVLAPLQIFLRNFFDLGLTWADPLLRVLVLWVGLMGAVSASRGNRHITVDVLSRLLPVRPRAALGVVTSAFTAAVSGIVAWHSGQFVSVEREFGSEAFSGIQAWIFEIVIPIAFGIMAIRYLLLTFEDAGVFLGLREPAPEHAREADGDVP